MLGWWGAGLLLRWAVCPRRRPGLRHQKRLLGLGLRLRGLLRPGKASDLFPRSLQSLQRFPRLGAGRFPRRGVAVGSPLRCRRVSNWALRVCEGPARLSLRGHWRQLRLELLRHGLRRLGGGSAQLLQRLLIQMRFPRLGVGRSALFVGAVSRGRLSDFLFTFPRAVIFGLIS